MAQDNPTRTLLLRRLDDLLASSRTRALTDAEATEVRSTVIAIEALSAPAPKGEYAGYRVAIDAVLAYLDRHGGTAPRTEMAHAIVAGGFGAHTKRPLQNVLDSIRYHRDAVDPCIVVDREDFVKRKT